jgi:hypothetical protein
VIINYHEKIFINPLDDIEIGLLKKKYKEDEISQIFKPVTRIKSPRSPYKVAYFDSETYRKQYVASIAKAQRKKLLPLDPPSAEDIGVLESSIIHSRRTNVGTTKRNVIQREQLKTAELEFKTGQIEPKEHRPLILNESIVVDLDFDASRGFTFSYDDLKISHTDTDYAQGLQVFYGQFYDRLMAITRQYSLDKKSSTEWTIITRLLNDPLSLLK